METGIAYGQAARDEIVEKLMSVLTTRREPQATTITMQANDSSPMVA